MTTLRKVVFRSLGPTSTTLGLDIEDFSEAQFVLPYQPMVYTTEWQEVVIDLGPQDETIWDGLLKDIQLSFVLEGAEASRAGELVKWFEIDWIELTGVEEQLQGELALLTWTICAGLRLAFLPRRCSIRWRRA